MERKGGKLTSKKSREKEGRSRIQEQVCTIEDICRTIWIQFSSFFTYFLTYSLIETMYFMTDILLLVFLLQVIN